MAKYDPPREYAESHSFQQDFDDLTQKYPGLIEIIGALLWGIGENPFDFGLVPGYQSEGIRVAKSKSVLLEEEDTEAVILRVFFVVPESGPIEIMYLDMELGNLDELGS